MKLEWRGVLINCNMVRSLFNRGFWPRVRRVCWHALTHYEANTEFYNDIDVEARFNMDLSCYGGCHSSELNWFISNENNNTEFFFETGANHFVFFFCFNQLWYRRASPITSVLRNYKYRVKRLVNWVLISPPLTSSSVICSYSFHTFLLICHYQTPKLSLTTNSLLRDSGLLCS